MTTKNETLNQNQDNDDETSESGLFDDVWDLSGKTDDDNAKQVKHREKDSADELCDKDDWDDVVNVYEDHSTKQASGSNESKGTNVNNNVKNTTSNIDVKKPDNKSKQTSEKVKPKNKLKQQFKNKPKVSNTRYEDEYDDTYDAFYN